MGEAEREYAYKPKWSVIVFGAAFFGLCAVVLGRKASLNDRGLIINGVVELGPEGASAFYWVLTALMAAFVAASAFLVYHRLAYQQRLLFGPGSLTVPASRWSRAVKEIAYRDIRALSERSINGQRFLDIVHADGKSTLTASMLPSKAVFDEVCGLLAAKSREAQAAVQSQAEPDAAPDPARM